MKPSSIIGFAGAVACAGALHVSAAGAATESVLHSFGSTSDGAWPYASLIKVNGTLYGTTDFGGTYELGTVFSINPATGAETVLHSFDNSDGANPAAKLINANGTLYGTTLYGGANGAGTLFSITPSGTETVLHSYIYGSAPYAGLVDVEGTLYGTTMGGGGPVATAMAAAWCSRSPWAEPIRCCTGSRAAATVPTLRRA